MSERDREEIDMRISDLSKVEITVADENSQMCDFMNATLQGSMDGKWAVSIATYLEIPNGLATVDELKAHVRTALSMAAAGSDLVFDAQVGKSMEYEDIVEEEAEDYDPDEEDL